MSLKITIMIKITKIIKKKSNALAYLFYNLTKRPSLSFYVHGKIETTIQTIKTPKEQNFLFNIISPSSKKSIIALAIIIPATWFSTSIISCFIYSKKNCIMEELYHNSFAKCLSTSIIAFISYLSCNYYQLKKDKNNTLNQNQEETEYKNSIISLQNNMTIYSNDKKTETNRVNFIV